MMLPVLLVESGSAAARFIDVAELAWAAAVGEGNFSCCALRHAPLHGRSIECEKIRMRCILGSIINSRIKALQLRAGGAAIRRCRWLLCSRARLLRGLPCAVSPAPSAAPETPEEALLALKLYLAWSETDEADGARTGVTLLHFAVMCAARHPSTVARRM